MPTEPRTPRLYHAVGDAAFSPRSALAILAAAFATLLVVGSVVTAAGAPALIAMMAGELMLVALPVSAALRTRRRPAALGLTRPTARFVVAGLLVGGSAWYLNLWLVELLPLPDGRVHVLQELVDGPPLVVTVIAIAVVPAVCEEVMFRGVLLRAFATRFTAAVAITLTALVFAAYHLSLIQLVPTFTLGLALGALALRARSALPSMLAHLCNNLLAILIARDELPALAGWLDAHPYAAVAVASLLTTSGLVLALRGRR